MGMFNWVLLLCNCLCLCLTGAANPIGKLINCQELRSESAQSNIPYQNEYSICSVHVILIRLMQLPRLGEMSVKLCTLGVSLIHGVLHIFKLAVCWNPCDQTWSCFHFDAKTLCTLCNGMFTSVIPPS